VVIIVNNEIKAGHIVSTEVMPIKKAKELGESLK